ncbi:MAG: LuxR C-terminal-related transcriptional regulator [Bacteroidota bacterium]|jgi:DNA-binding CsgD family transcriptional regulator
MNNNNESIISQAKEIWTEMTHTHPEQNESNLYDEESLNFLSRNAHTVIAIISIKKYKKLYISNNVKDIFGYTAEDEPTLGILQYIGMMSLDHAFFPIIAGRWYLKCLKNAPLAEKNNQKIVFVGPKMTTRQGKTIKTFIQTTHLEEDADKNPINIINSIQVITHLMKDDFWWMRYSYGENPQKVKYYHSSFGKTFEGDILSEREKDILRLIQDGLDSNEIAEKLFLSLATVHTHRRNMLARTGMKDVTALLQIAISIGMI